MSDAFSLHYQVIKTESSHGRSRLGEVALSAAGQLAVVQAPTESRAMLDRLVALINSKPLLHADMRAPAGAPPGAQYSRGVGRFEPQFFDALQAFLFKHYGIFLAPAGPVETAVPPATELPATE